MEISRIEVVNNNVKDYVEYVFNEYITNVTCPIDDKIYKEWFMCEFLPCCITRWYEPSCYDVTNMFSIDEFFDNSIHVFSEILQLLSDYFDEFDKTRFIDKFNPENVMKCYVSVYVLKNIEYFLDKYKYDESDESDKSNVRSVTSSILTDDLFQSIENTNQDINEDNEGENGSNESENEHVIEPLHIINDDETTVDETTTVEDDEDTTNSSLPTLINIIDDDESYDGDNDNDDELYETGIFVSQAEFNEKNKNDECIICWDVVMNHYNSMKWKNCDHFTCIYCHDECMAKRLHRCPLCRM
jgi:regulator of replication initiation timing